MDQPPTPHPVTRRSPRPAPHPSARGTLRARVLLPVSALALTGAFGAGVVVARAAQPDVTPVGRVGGADPDGGRPGVEPVAFGDAPGLRPTSCEDLLEHYVDAALGRVGPYGWDTETGWAGDAVTLDLPAGGDAGARSDSAESAESAESGTPGTSRVTASETGTNVQEDGVDEPDVVKTDGHLLARVDGADLVTADVSGTAVRERARLDLEDLGKDTGLQLSRDAVASAELLLAGDTLVVVADDEESTSVVALDVADPSAPSILEHVVYDAALVTARQHGTGGDLGGDLEAATLRLVLVDRLPRLDFREPGRFLGQESARAANEELVRSSTLEEWLPARSVDGAPAEGFLDCADVAVPEDALPLGTTVVVGSAAETPSVLTRPVTSDGPAGGAAAVAVALPLAYESTDRLFLATGGEATGWIDPLCLGLCRTVEPGVPDGATHLYGFALDGAEVDYLGAGRVEGRLTDRWSMDAQDDRLRLAVESSSETRDATSLVVLDAVGSGADAALSEVGRLDGVAPGEQLTSVRWFEDLAVLVTFRQVDPLFTVDLSDADRPRLLGELTVPGFSSYLHPLGSQRLLGIGEGPLEGPGGRPDDGRGWGARAALFDVTDLGDVRRLDVVDYAPGSRAGAATDPRQLTWLPAERTALVVVHRGRRHPTTWVSTLRVGEGALDNRVQRVSRGRDGDAVRIVPLPDDRVVLVTGDGARFFDL